jgi:hypothetical protein
MARGTIKIIPTGPSKWIASALLIALCLVNAEAFGRVRDSEMSILDFVNKVVALDKITPLEVESLLGEKLSPVSASSGEYTAHDIKFEDATIELLDYRGANFLSLKLSGGCVSRAKVLEDYKPLTIAGVPSGHSADEQTYFSKPEKWGELAFGFPENNSKCLRTVVFKIN